MIKYETTKLFYDKYLFKLGIYNPVAFIFRNKNLSHARTIIDDLQLHQEEPIQYKTCSDALRHIDLTVDELHDLKYLLTQFQDQTDFMVRCEQNKMGIFSNNDSWLKRVGKKLDCVCDFYEPADSTIDLLLNSKNVLIKNAPFDHKYKVTLGENSIDRNFYNWAKNNPDKVRVSPGLLRTIQENGYVRANIYIFVMKKSSL